MRSFIINALYDVANALCILADALAPQDDSVWRQRRWDTYGVTARPNEPEVVWQETSPGHYYRRDEPAQYDGHYSHTLGCPDEPDCPCGWKMQRGTIGCETLEEHQRWCSTAKKQQP